MEVYAAEPEACRIEFHLDFEFTNKLIELAFGRVFKSWRLIWSGFYGSCERGLQCRKIAVEVAYALPESSTCSE